MCNFYLNAYDTPLIEPDGSGFSGQDRDCSSLKTIKSKGHNTGGRDANH